MRFPRHVAIDFSDFSLESKNPAARYGLRTDVHFCRKCVISNQRPSSAVEFRHDAKTLKKTIFFDSDGICDACHVAELKHQQVDWEERRRRLVELCDEHRSKTGDYDCLVPGSGGKDSFYASHVLKYEYGMHPLTVTWAPHIYTEWGWRNFQSWIHSGVDNHLLTPNGRVHRLLTRLAVENLFHPFQPFILGQKNVAPKMAAQMNIPLVFYGEHEAEYGNPRADFESPLRSQEYYSSTQSEGTRFGGVAVEELIADFGLEAQDFIPYMPADPARLAEAKIEIHYLGYYLKWHPQSCYYYAVEHGGFEAAPERTPGTYSKYNSIDDRIDDLHYYTTGIKFGIGRATYDAAQEIRSGDITREEGVALVKRFDNEYPDRFERENFEYMSLPPEEFPLASAQFEQPVMDRDYFLHLADRFRSPHLWSLEGDDWKLRNVVWNGSNP